MPSSSDVTKTFSPDETQEWYDGLEKRFSSADVWCEAPDGRLLIVKSPYKHFWSIPGGIIDAYEMPKQAAVRETEEEVGILLDSESLEFAMSVSRVLGRLGHNYQFIFRATLSQQQIDTMKLRDGEISDAMFVSREDVTDNTSNMPLGAAIIDWARGRRGYDEKVFPPK